MKAGKKNNNETLSSDIKYVLGEVLRRDAPKSLVITDFYDNKSMNLQKLSVCLKTKKGVKIPLTSELYDDSRLKTLCDKNVTRVDYPNTFFCDTEVGQSGIKSGSPYLIRDAKIN